MDFSEVRSANSSVVRSESSFVGRETCHICKRSMTEGLSLHSCKFCGKIVCNQHSTRKRDLSNQVLQARICDKCHKDIIGARIEGDHKAEIKCLRRQLEDVLADVSRRSENLDEKSSLISAKRSELSSLTAFQSQRISTLAHDLEDSRLQCAAQRASLMHTKEAVRISQISLESIEKNLCEKQAEIDAVSKDIDAMAEKFPELEENLNATRGRMALYMSASRANRMLCPRCKGKLEKELMTKCLNSKQKTGGPTQKVCLDCVCM